MLDNPSTRDFGEGQRFAYRNRNAVAVATRTVITGDAFALSVDDLGKVAERAK